jgi:hypothetical protein
MGTEDHGPRRYTAAMQLAATIARGVVDPFSLTDAAIRIAAARQGDQREDAGKGTDPILDLVDVHDEEDPLGDEVRDIDNGKSGSTLTRQFTATREWRRTVTIGSVKTVSGSAGIDSVGLKASVEAAIRESYNEETEIKHVFSETTTISVPPRTSIRMVLSWKALVRSGIVRITDPDGSVYDVPYRVVTGVTFDQTIQDRTAE